MKKLISFQNAIQFSLALFGLFILFHLIVILGIVFFDYVPVDYLWGGRMETKEQLMKFEIASLLVMALCFILVLLRRNNTKYPKIQKVLTILFWLLSLLFLLNTIGNFLAKTYFEKFFAIATLLLAFLSIRLALGK